VACEDRSVNVFNLIGQRIFPSIVLGGKVSMLEVNGHLVLVVTSTGAVYVWNIQKRQCVVKNEQLSAIMKSLYFSSLRLIANSNAICILWIYNKIVYRRLF